MDVPRGIQVVHDVRDACLTDRHGRKIGRVDSLVLSVAPGQPVRVAAILMGGAVRARRIGAWTIWLRGVLSRALRVDPKLGVSRVSFSRVREIGDTITLDVDRSELPSEHLERWLGANVIDRIPGSHGERK